MRKQDEVSKVTRGGSGRYGFEKTLKLKDSYDMGIGLSK